MDQRDPTEFGQYGPGRGPPSYVVLSLPGSPPTVEQPRRDRWVSTDDTASSGDLGLSTPTTYSDPRDGGLSGPKLRRIVNVRNPGVRSEDWIRSHRSKHFTDTDGGKLP